MIQIGDFQGDNWLQLWWRHPSQNAPSRWWIWSQKSDKSCWLKATNHTPTHLPCTNPPTMHQASIFDNFHIFTTCIQIIFNYKLASRISINRVNLFVLYIIQFEISLSICLKKVWVFVRVFFLFFSILFRISFLFFYFWVLPSHPWKARLS